MAYLGRKSGNAALTSADIPDNSITGAKIVDDAIDSEHYAAGSVDAVHVAADVATQAELDLKANLTNAALVTPNLGTPSAGVMTNVTGMPLAGLSATGTASATTYLRGDNSWQPAGTIIKTTSYTSTADLSISASIATVVEADENDITVVCTIGNKLHIWIVGGMLYAATSVSTYWHGLRIIESGESDIDKRIGFLVSRASSDYKNDSVGSVAYTHTAVTASVTIKRLLSTESAKTVYWQTSGSDGISYLIMEEQV